MLSIKTNIMAENASRYLGQSYSALSKSIERLSSGLRINSAKDDAAGLAVRELMRADVAVLKQGTRNANDGISMLQTMEGAMAVVDDALIRMKSFAGERHGSCVQHILWKRVQEMMAEIPHRRQYRF